MIGFLLGTSQVFAAESSSGVASLGVDGKALILQIVTFVIVFLLLKRFAFGKIVATLEQRRKTIDDGVRLGQEMAEAKAKLGQQTADIVAAARVEADKIITAGHNEATQLIKEAEQQAARRVEAMVAEAQGRMQEDLAHARKALERDMLNLVSEATEIVIGEKLDAKKDATLIERALKEQTAR